MNVENLKKLGFNYELNKKTFRFCLECLEQEYKRGGSDQKFYDKARTVWTGFSRQLEHVQPPWTKEQLNDLANYHFVPVRQNIYTSASYRDRFRQTTYVVATMGEVVASRDMAITWTVKLIAEIAPAPWTIRLFNFEPRVYDVAKHLVGLTTTVAKSCDIGEEMFYRDLRDTYDYLNLHADAAGVILRTEFAGKELWLNEDDALESIPRSRSNRIFKRYVGSLNWLPSKSLMHGVPYDIAASKLYAVKYSIQEYQNLLEASGSNVVNFVRAPTLTGSRVNTAQHANSLLQAVNNMRSSESLCDMVIVVGRKQFFVHRSVLAAFSTYFRALAASRQWKESIRGTLDLDSGIGQSNQKGLANYATAESVASVIEWIYTGSLELNEKAENTETVEKRLDGYLDIIQLADVWDIPGLKELVEDRILQKAREFIRVENVRPVLDLAKQYNAKQLERYCQEVFNMNKDIVQVIEGAPQESKRSKSWSSLGERMLLKIFKK